MADERVEIVSKNDELFGETEIIKARQYSSSRNKFYTIRYNPAIEEIMPNDNATWFTRYLGYPAISLLLFLKKIEFDHSIIPYFKDIAFKDIKPEDTFEGKIIVLDIPYHTYTKVGRMAQIIFKFLWQLAVQERPINEETKPVFLWVDEAQYFVTDYDDIFQSTARSARVATVYLTQNLHAYEKFINNRSGVKYLLANFQTIIFHCNSDPETNKFASELFKPLVSEVV